MTEHDNVEILRSLYEKWGDQTLEASNWLDLLADDVQWRSIGDGAPGMEFSSASRGKNEVARYFEGLADDWEMLHYNVDEFVAQGDRVVVIGRCGWKSRNTGKTLDTPKVDIFRMRDGKVTEFYEFFDTAKALEAARGNEMPAP